MPMPPSCGQEADSTLEPVLPVAEQLGFPGRRDPYRVWKTKAVAFMNSMAAGCSPEGTLRSLLEYLSTPAATCQVCRERPATAGTCVLRDSPSAIRSTPTEGNGHGTATGLQVHVALPRHRDTASLLLW